MKRGTDCSVITEPRCDNCDSSMSNASCIECGISLTEYIDEEIVCYGPKEQSWHSCKDCDTKLRNKKCQKCKGDHLDRFGVDKKSGKIIVMYTCKDCKHQWEEKNVRTEI